MKLFRGVKKGVPNGPVSATKRSIYCSCYALMSCAKVWGPEKSFNSRAKKAHKHKEIPRKLPTSGPTQKSFYVGVLFLENQGEETPHIKNLGSQIFMLGTPLILYVGVLYVLFFRPLSIAKNHPKPSQEFSEQFGPSIHKMKGFGKNSPQKVHPDFAQNLDRQILGNTFSGLKKFLCTFP